MTGTVYDPPCHISNPWFCKRRLADNSAIYHKAFLAYKNLTTPEMFVNNDYCVQWDINRDYWVSYNVVHPYQKKDSDAGIALTSSATIFIALLLIELALLI